MTSRTSRLRLSAETMAVSKKNARPGKDFTRELITVGRSFKVEKAKLTNQGDFQVSNRQTSAGTCWKA